ncbi:MAG TPA: TRAP transporter large permease [Aestuariivirgaceae bacterium]|nr:TRAP transporter large permease [Aestuariivirgaceae bacterium]
MTILLMLLAMFALILINVPIAVALGLVGVVAVWVTQGPDMLPNVAIVMFEGASSFPLLAIPMFILAGALMNASSISLRLFALASALLGFIRGGLAMVNVGVSMFFSELSGSAVAGVAATAPLLIPAMHKRGYPRPFTAAVTSSSATLAIILPPSIPMILYGVMAEASIVQLFVAGIVPGLIAGFLMMALCYYYARRYNWPVEEIFNLCRVWVTFKEAFWALFLPVIILGGIFGGVVTATEGGALAVVAALFLGVFVYRDLDLKFLYEAIIEGAIQTAVVMLLVAASALVGVYLTEMRIPGQLAVAILSVTSESWAILALLNIFFLAIGLFLHSAAAIILVVPVVMPLVVAAGIDPIHFGVVVCLNLSIGQQTPPVASVLITTCAIAKADVWEVTRANMGFIGVLTATLLISTYIPAVPLVLVEYFYR